MPASDACSECRLLSSETGPRPRCPLSLLGKQHLTLTTAEQHFLVFLMPPTSFQVLNLSDIDES